MRDYEDAASTCLSQSPASRSHRRRWLRIDGLDFVLAFMLAIGVGLSTSATRAEALASRDTSSFQKPGVSHRGPINGQQGTSTAGDNGQCDGTGSNSRPINGQQGTSTAGGHQCDGTDSNGTGSNSRPVNGPQGTSTAGDNGQCGGTGSNGTGSNSRPINRQQGTSTAGDNGQCSTLTVTSVNGSTIVAQSSCSSSITVHTTTSTQYVQAGRNVSVSAITVGSRVYVAGSQNSDGSITASRIDIN